MRNLVTQEDRDLHFERIARETVEIIEKKRIEQKKIDDERVTQAVRQIALMMIENGGQLEEGSGLWKLVYGKS